MRLLLEKGADVNARDSCLSSPLHLAVEKTPILLDVVTTLLKFGGDPNARDDMGDTPLHSAAQSAGWRSDEVMKVLLDHGALVDVENSFGSTPLQVKLIYSR